MNKNGLVLVLFIILIGLFNVTIIYLEKNKLVKDFINIKYSNDINENKEYIVTVEYKSKNNLILAFENNLLDKFDILNGKKTNKSR